MFSFSNSQPGPSNRPRLPFHGVIRSLASSTAVSSKSILASSTTQPTHKPGPGSIAGGIVGALVLFVLFVGLIVFYIRRKGPASHSTQHHNNADSSTNNLVSASTPLDTEASESAAKAVTSHASSPELPFSDAPTSQYSVFGISPPPSPTNSNRSTQTDAVARKVVTPCNSPLSTDAVKRRGIGFTESGRPISPRVTVARISERLEEAEAAEQAQNANVDH